MVNGDTERAHLIFDVPFNPKLKDCIDQSIIWAGEVNPEYAAKIRQKQVAIASYPGDVVIRSGIKTLRSQGLDDAKIAVFMNEKKIPPKHRSKSGWDVATIAEMVPR